MHPPSPGELIEIQARTLFVHDDSGRLLRTNDGRGSPAPCFFLGRTAEGNIWRYGRDLPRDVVAALEAVASTEPVVANLEERPASIALYEGILRGHAPLKHTHAGPAYRFPDEAQPIGDAQFIGPADAELLRACLPDWIPELAALQPVFGLVRDGMAVSICATVRRSPEAAEAGVETHRDHRMAGYAGAVVAAWADAIRDEGLIPLYSTDWSNAASRSVARRLSLVMYGEDVGVT